MKYNKLYLSGLSKQIIMLHDEKEISDFLIDILTLEELNKIPMRLQIIIMLKKGMTQREIAKQLKVSITTVTHGSILIKKGAFKKIK